MPERILNIIEKINNGEADKMSHRELLMAMVYAQSLSNEKQDQVIKEIRELKEHNNKQDINTDNLESLISLQNEKILSLEHKLEIQVVKDQEKTKRIAWLGTALGAILAIMKLWDYISNKLAFIVYKTGIWGF